MLHHRLLPILLAALLALGACTDDAPPPDDDTVREDAVDATWSDVEIDDGEVALVDADRRRTVARLDPEEHGEVLHASLRPGSHASTTVLLLTRLEERYELRYLLVSREGRDSELYGLPWRLQVDEDLARVADVAPTPVWSPDGATIAWLEWDDEGTRLRTVGWVDRGPRSNPSDDAHTYRVDEVPVGTQLERWEQDGARPALLGHDGERPWRIELDLEQRAVALPGQSS